MLLTREGDCLFLYTLEDEEHTKIMVYDGSQGTPNRFYFISDGSMISRCLKSAYFVIINPGLIMMKDINDAEWRIHKTDRDDEPIDLYVIEDCINDSMNFLYSDMSTITIDLTDIEYRITHLDGISILGNSEINVEINGTKQYFRSDEMIRRGIITLPLHTLYNGGCNNNFLVKSDNDRLLELYLRKHENNYVLLVYNIGSRCEMDNIISISHNCCCTLRNDGLLFSYFNLYEGVVKRDHRVSMILFENGDVKSFDFTSNKYEVEIAENVSNFYASPKSQILYIIRGNELLYSIALSEFKLVTDASNIRFPTNSYYDCQLNRSVNVKSSRQ